MYSILQLEKHPFQHILFTFSEEQAGRVAVVLRPGGLLVKPSVVGSLGWQRVVLLPTQLELVEAGHDGGVMVVVEFVVACVPDEPADWGLDGHRTRFPNG